MVLRHEDRDHPSAWIPGVPMDFSGCVSVDKPDYLVEVQPVMDGVDEQSDSDETRRFLVNIDSDITVTVTEVLRTLPFFFVFSLYSSSPLICQRRASPLKS